ncbi:conserved hypothetical protein [Uncinocarpus reesii 1704]|uniref:Uncharacterized protein n=1 Tax=Uncinocarpus reesii (strain UAMH 1704) TaxID=336963 RepID=C4JH65_UNCRE|nr:uncharacterized protein UREG_02638 [Uncinocarpus reesii 1704]EEP77789.1 conserved hypothetical protein [Uncinocarpus reesii 1704]
MQNAPASDGTNWFGNDDGPRASASTYASTLPPHNELEKRNHVELVQERYEAFPADAIASTPDRKFSLRRYCRQSGREVCHSLRKYRRAPGEKRGASFPWTGFPSFWPKSNAQRNPRIDLRRQDSGYKSGLEEDAISQRKECAIDDTPFPQDEPSPTNTIKLEFSNYAHVDIERRGSRISKRYDYEYWSTKYQWRRSIQHDTCSETLSYHLYDLNKPKPVAHIVPESLAPMEALDEESKGGWVPPSSIWISDASIFEKMSDIAEWVLP